ncbi:MAG: efflux transporter outer membrane subunit [Holophaga sp.]|nr:efflux transporter outer membrane subunit [Holophaga sp.]
MKISTAAPPLPPPPSGSSLGRGLAGLLLLGLAGCAVGPQFQAPQPPRTGQYGAAPLPDGTAATPTALGEAQRFVRGGRVAERWWTAFGSPELDARVAQALQHSPTVASAQAALRRAQENLRAANGGRMPALDLRAGVTRENVDASGAISSAYTLYNASVNVSYTLDLFGGVRRGIEYQQALADQQRRQLEGVYLALAANVTTASIQEAGLRAQLQSAEAVVTVLQEQLELTRQQIRLGAKSEVDLLAAQANLASAQAGLPGLRQQLGAVRNQLSAYLGRFPSEGGMGPQTLDRLTLPRDLPVTLPSALVRQRPDVLAAEAMLHAATAQVGLATANMLPSLTLGGSYGPQTTQSRTLLQNDMMAWNAGLSLLQPLFHGGTLRAQKRAAAAGLDQALADYRTTVLTAFANVADALDALQFDAETLQARTEAERAAASSLAMVQSQYHMGAASYLQMLDATRLWQTARAGLIQAQTTRLADTAALYAALGGGWNAQAN